MRGQAVSLADQAFSNPTLTGTQTGNTYPLGQSWTAVNGAADTNENILGTVTIPANTLRANDSLRIYSHWTVTNNANVKTIKIRLGGIGGTVYLTQNLASQTTMVAMTIIGNITTSSQIGPPNSNGGSFGQIGAAATTSAIDTTASTTLVFTVQKATAGDTMTLAGYTVEVIRA